MNKEEIIEFLKNNLKIRIYVCNTKCNEISIKLLINDE
jgi:hypothetical protein